jgi:hypothetical protein
MQPTDLDEEEEQESNVGFSPIITPEEFEALMSGLANLESELEYLPKILAAEARLKRLESMLIIQMALFMAVFLLFRIY